MIKTVKIWQIPNETIMMETERRESTIKKVYQNFFENASEQLAQIIFSEEKVLPERARFFDGEVKEILRQVGLKTMGSVFALLSAQLCEEAKGCVSSLMAYLRA